MALSICLIVEQSPGIHFRGLGRAANVSSTGQLRHHLDRLRRHGALIEVVDGRFRRYFVPGHDARTRETLARFSRPVPYQIARTLLQGPMRRARLRHALRCADSTLGYHLNRMTEAGDIVCTRGRASAFYSLVDPGFVRGVLILRDGADVAENELPESLGEATAQPQAAVATDSMARESTDGHANASVRRDVAVES